MLRGILDALTARKSKDAINIQALIGYYPSSCLYLTGLQLAPHHHEDITILSLMTHPVLVLIVGDG